MYESIGYLDEKLLLIPYYLYKHINSKQRNPDSLTNSKLYGMKYIVVNTDTTHIDVVDRKLYEDSIK